MIVVSGYYGFGNLGDEAILAVLCQDLESLGFERRQIVVLSGHPQATRALHQVQSLNRFDFPGIWKALGSARGLVSGGGSLLQDVTSRRSISYYLGLVELALARRVPVIIYGQGIGPVQSAFFQAWVRRAFQKSAAFSLRDGASAELLSAWGVSSPEAGVGADPVFQWEMKPRQTADSRRILLNLRPYGQWPGHAELWLEFLKDCRDLDYEVEFIPLGPGDEAMGKKLKEGFSPLVLHARLSLGSPWPCFDGALLCVSMRLHGLIFSALHDLLPVGLNYDPKVEAISAQLQVPCFELSQVAFLSREIPKIIEDYSTYRHAYHQALADLRKKTAVNRAGLAQVLIQG